MPKLISLFPFSSTPDVCGIPCALTNISEVDQDDQIRLENAKGQKVTKTYMR